MRPARWPAFFFLLFAALLIAACGGTIDNANWPGASAAGNTVFLAYGPKVVALDLAAEEELWSFPAEATGRAAYYAPPGVQDGKVIVGDYGAAGGLLSGRVTVTLTGLATEDGAADVDWTNDSIAHDKIVAQPLQVGDRVFVTTADSFVYALDADTGQPLWPEGFQAGHSIWGQPTYEEGRLYVAAMDGHLHLLNADTGQEIWRHQFDGALASKPILGATVVYITSYGKKAYAVSKETGDVVWSADAASAIWAAPVLDGEVLYYVDRDGNLYAVDAQSGAPVWPEPLALGEYVTATPALRDGVLYVATAGARNVEQELRRGTVRAISAVDGSEIWSSEAPAPVQGPLVLTEDRVAAPVLSSEALLVVYDLAEGDQVWSYLPPAQ
jgi:outer membrane protein assembly factor BamB